MNITSPEDIIIKIKEGLNLFLEIFENLLLLGNLYELEKLIMGFINKYVLSPIYKFIFLKLGETDEKVKKVAEKEGYNQIKRQEVKVTIPTGEKIRVKSLYAYNNKDRSKKGKHLTLNYFGIIGKKTPLTIKELTSTGIYSMSFKVAEDILKERGIQTTDNQIMKSTYELSNLSIQNRGEISFSEGENFEGSTVIIGLDGGRIKTRVNKRGRKTSKNRHNYNGIWREPKNFVIGKLGKTLKLEGDPIYDGVIGSGEEMGEILKKYLKHGKIHLAKKICVVGDGAKWQWSKIKQILKDLGVDKNKIQLILDYFHGSEHIHDFVSALGLGDKESKKALNRFKRLFWKGRTDDLIKEMSFYCKGKNKELLKKKIGYFTRNKERIIDYSSNKKNNLPCGSGIIESMIRRVVNLRMKGNSIFWKCTNANLMLYMRSQILSGRYNLVFENTLKMLKTGYG